MLSPKNGIDRQFSAESILHEEIKRRSSIWFAVQTILGWLFVVGTSGLIGYGMGRAF